MKGNWRLSSSMRGAIGLFVAVAGLVGVAVTIWTAPSMPRTVSLVLLFGGALLLLLGAGIPEVLRYRRANAALPSHEELLKIATPYSVEQANSDEVAWIARLEASVYSETDAIPERLLREWYSVNPTGFSIVKAADGKPVGHLDILPLKPKTLEAFLRGEITEHEIRGDSLYSPDQRKSIRHLYVESIILRPPRTLSNAAAVVSVLSSISLILERVADLATVERVYAIAATSSGEALMRDLGFELHCEGDRRRDGHNLFEAQPAAIVRNVLKICGRRLSSSDALKTLVAGV